MRPTDDELYPLFSFDICLLLLLYSTDIQERGRRCESYACQSPLDMQTVIVREVEDCEFYAPVRRAAADPHTESEETARACVRLMM